MWYVICFFSGTALGLIGGLVMSRASSRKSSGEGAALSPEQLERIKEILEHIREGDELVKEIEELLGKKGT